MAHFVRTREVWFDDTDLLYTEVSDIDVKTFKAINGDDGGTWAPVSEIVIGGAGVRVTSDFRAEGDLFRSEVDLFLVIATDISLQGSTSISGATTFGSTVFFGDDVEFEGNVAIDASIVTIAASSLTLSGGGLIVAETAQFNSSVLFQDPVVFADGVTFGGVVALQCGVQATFSAFTTFTATASFTASVNIGDAPADGLNVFATSFFNAPVTATKYIGPRAKSHFLLDDNNQDYNPALGKDILEAVSWSADHYLKLLAGSSATDGYTVTIINNTSVDMDVQDPSGSSIITLSTIGTGATNGKWRFVTMTWSQDTGSWRIGARGF